MGRSFSRTRLALWGEVECLFVACTRNLTAVFDNFEFDRRPCATSSEDGVFLSNVKIRGGCLGR